MEARSQRLRKPSQLNQPLAKLLSSSIPPGTAPHLAASDGGKRRGVFRLLSGVALLAQPLHQSRQFGVRHPAQVVDLDVVKSCRSDVIGRLAPVVLKDPV